MSVLTAASAFVVAMLPASAIADDTGPVPRTTVGSVMDDAEKAEAEAAAEQVTATYKGKTIDLEDGWDGALVCTEIPTGKVLCHDSVAEADKALAKIPAHVEHVKKARAQRDAELDRQAAANTKTKSAVSGQISTESMQTTSISDCYSGYACLYQYPGYGGRILRWSASGNKYLSKWDFRDRASAECTNRSRGAHGEDYRTGMPDPEIWFGAGYCYGDFRDYEYAYGGDWNNKMDLFVLS